MAEGDVAGVFSLRAISAYCGGVRIGQTTPSFGDFGSRPGRIVGSVSHAAWLVLVMVWMWPISSTIAPLSDTGDNGGGDPGRRHTRGFARRITSFSSLSSALQHRD
jgi:hypothetical protein